jgi:hypothetical protein
MVNVTAFSFVDHEFFYTGRGLIKLYEVGICCICENIYKNLVERVGRMNLLSS